MIYFLLFIILIQFAIIATRETKDYKYKLRKWNLKLNQKADFDLELALEIINNETYDNEKQNKYIEWLQTEIEEHHKKMKKIDVHLKKID
jgi:hypothetical protein